MLKKAFWLFAATVFMLVVFLPGYNKLRDLKDRNSDLEIKIKQLSIENALLQDELKKVESDPVYQEQIAREKMGIVRKGEIPIKIVAPSEKKE